MTLDPDLADLPRAIWEDTSDGPTLIVHFGLPSPDWYLDNLQHMLDPVNPDNFSGDGLRLDVARLDHKLGLGH